MGSTKVPHQKNTGQISNTAGGMLKALHPQAGAKQYRRQATEETGGTFGAPVEHRNNRYSDYPRTAKAAGRFLRCSIKVLHEQPPAYRYSDTAAIAEQAFGL